MCLSREDIMDMNDIIDALGFAQVSYKELQDWLGMLQVDLIILRDKALGEVVDK